MDNKIERRTIGSLFGEKFYIPSYQRGYRWTEQQVKDLLNDIREFQIRKSESEDFYCLQPLVVKKKWSDDILASIKNANSVDIVEKIIRNCSWEVIDGQQRLTTIFIILSYLGVDMPFSLEYETRSNFKDFLNTLKKHPDIEEFSEMVNGLDDYDNIDFFHVFCAYKAIAEYKPDSDIKATLLNKVEFIWYEAVEENPIKVFTRLNIGKIALTNAELIKALLLNRSNFGGTVSQIRLQQQEIAMEWDNIEYTLQNEEFWLFIHNLGYNRPTRIDFIFDLIVEQNALNIPEETRLHIGTDEYRTFRYFYGFVNSNNSEKAIVDCWKKVKDYYNIFREWYDDLELYHYVGYLINQKNNPQKPLNSLKSLLDLWNQSSNKKVFVEKLHQEIRELIKNGYCSLSQQYEIEYQNEQGIKQGAVNKTNCRNILLLHNIQTVINQANINVSEYQQSVFYKFPFHLYKKEGWDVEHIDSNTENELVDKSAQNEFLLNIYQAANEEEKKLIESFVNNPNETDFSPFEKFYVKSEDSLSDEEKNQICNFTLLDSSTNRSYGNSIFPAKRRIIIGKDSGKYLPIPQIKANRLVIGEETLAPSAFIPPCTKQVFMKYYSSAAGDMNYWTKADADAYRRNIYDTLKGYGVSL